MQYRISVHIISQLNKKSTPKTPTMVLIYFGGEDGN